MRWCVVIIVVGCRFAPNAATSTGDDASADSSSPDAFDAVASCPPDYTITLQDSASRYRLITSGAKAWDQSDACNADKVAFTHLVSIDDPTELARVQALLDSHTDVAAGVLWIGTTQRRSATAVKQDWLTAANRPLIDVWLPGEPDDGGSNIENHVEQFAGIARTVMGFIDYPGNFQHGALCECDGHPLDPAIAGIIDSNRF